MQHGKFNIFLDSQHGSSGKGLMTPFLADRYESRCVSTANFPNAGHVTRRADGSVFMAKAIATAAFLNRYGQTVDAYISPGSGFYPERFLFEWNECGRPDVYIHGRASVVTEDHAAREREGKQSTKHIASTMQGSGVAISDKVMRGQGILLARNIDWELEAKKVGIDGDLSSIHVLSAQDFRNRVFEEIPKTTWLHEGSQGYALSIDHGSHYPQCTSRNCSAQAAMDYMAIPPKMVGDVYLNVRTFPIRVGNVKDDDGNVLGYSGDFYPDQTEITWDKIADDAGFPPEAKAELFKKEHTSVTKRLRRVSTLSYSALRDAVRVNGCTKLALNFVHYNDYKDLGVTEFAKLSQKTREMVDRLEDETGVRVALIGTSAFHETVILR